MPRSRVSASDAMSFLSEYHDTPVGDVEFLSGGFWSSAYGYRLGEQELVARFGELRVGFEMDRAAMAFNRPDLPVPHVLDVGDAFDGAFAISVRHEGRFLETIRADETAQGSAILARLLAALRAASPVTAASSAWCSPDDDAPSTWHEWLLGALATIRTSRSTVGGG